MALSKDEKLKTLILRSTDTSLGMTARLKAAKRIGRDFGYQDLVAPLSEMAIDPATPEMTVSLVMRALYVCMRKWPANAAPVEAFARILGARHLAYELRTQLFLCLLMLDLEQAEAAALAHMPEMLPLVRIERQSRTILEDMHDSDAPFNEAVTKILFF